MTNFVKDFTENKQIDWTVGDIFISSYGGIRIIAQDMGRFFLVDLTDGDVTTTVCSSLQGLLNEYPDSFKNAKKVHTAVLQDEQSVAPNDPTEWVPF